MPLDASKVRPQAHWIAGGTFGLEVEVEKTPLFACGEATRVDGEALVGRASAVLTERRVGGVVRGRTCRVAGLREDDATLLSLV